MTKYNTYEIKFTENDDFEFVDQLFINGEMVLESGSKADIELKIAEWEFKNDARLYTKERAAEKANGEGFSASDYEALQTEGHGYGEDTEDIPAWR